MSSLSIHEKPVDGARAAQYTSVYNGKFKDRNPDINSAGILTYAAGETVEDSLRQPSVSAPPSQVEKFRNYTSPQLGTIRHHYGKASDPRYYEEMSHGYSLNNDRHNIRELVNPKLKTNFEMKKVQMSESLYLSNKTKPLSKVPVFNLPRHIDPFTHTFGVETKQQENAKDAVNPDKSRSMVELESSDKHQMYVFSHSDYEPGEQKVRRYHSTFDKNKRFGLTTPVYHDGRMVNECLNWLPQKLLDKRSQVESSKLDDYKEKYTHQLGKALDPKKETRHVGPDHTFGLTNTADNFGAADVLHSRSIAKTLKGKERERAYLAVLRSHLCRHNITVFKTLVAAFKFYDQDKDGIIKREELRNACSKTGFPVADDLLDALIHECDQDKDGHLNFLEFSNFLCYKDSMPTGFNYDPNSAEVVKAKSENPSAEYVIKDDDGRPLLKESDLMKRNNIEVNEYVPRTLNYQIDQKIGNWKTTYDVINEAPFRPEPIVKRTYGVPSIRNDLFPPTTKKIVDKNNYGDDGNCWQLINPSIFTHHGIFERDVYQPRSKEEIRAIFQNTGIDISPEDFERAYNTAKSRNPYGEVSVEEFRSVYHHIKQEQVKAKVTELVCA